MEQLAQQIAAGGTVGLILALVVALWWFATGRGRVGTMVDKREQEIIAERDDWKALAQAATPEIKRLNDLLERALSKLP